MRVVLVVPGGMGADGVGEVIPARLPLVRRLAASYEVLVVTTDQITDPPAFELGGARVLALRRRRREPLARARTGWRTISPILAIRPDVIHAVWLGSYHESQGVAVFEAAMAGVPAVGTAVGLIAELAAADPPAAVAVPVGDAAALGDELVALARDPERRARLGVAARTWAMAHDADWTAASFEALYAEVVQRRRRR